MLLPRAEDGREDLAAALVAAGAQVTTVTAYRTVAAPGPELAPILARLRARELDVLTFFSPSQIAAVMAALGDDAVAVLNAARLICAIGSTTAAAAAAAGLRVDLVPPAPSADALAAALVAHSLEAR